MELAERQMRADMEMRKMRNMRKNYIVLLIPVVGCILLLQLGCQEQIKPEKAETSVRSDKGAPKISFENTISNFGQIGVTSGKKVAEFKFTNTGDSLLKITEVEKCCDVVPVLDKTEFAPGQSGVLKAEFQSNQKPGLMSLILYIRSNDTTKPRLALTIKPRESRSMPCCWRIVSREMRADRPVSARWGACPGRFPHAPFRLHS